MTLILGGAVRSYAFLVSDRRVSWNSVPLDDEFNKAIVVQCRDGRVAVSYAGLARWTDEFRVDLWLPEALSKAAPPDFMLNGIMERTAAAATKRFRAFRPNVPRKFTVLAVGFVETGDEMQPVWYRLQNWSDAGLAADFALERQLNRVFLTAAGAYTLFTDRARLELTALLEHQKPRAAVIDKAVAEIRRCAITPAGAGIIGKQCMSVIVPADPKEGPQAAYHTETRSTEYYFPTIVDARGGEHGVTVIANALVSTSRHLPAPGAPIVYPKIGRNDPCPCGSRLKYKRCHGRGN